MDAQVQPLKNKTILRERAVEAQMLSGSLRVSNTVTQTQFRKLLDSIQASFMFFLHSIPPDVPLFTLVFPL